MNVNELINKLKDKYRIVKVESGKYRIQFKNNQTDWQFTPNLFNTIKEAVQYTVMLWKEENGPD